MASQEGGKGGQTAAQMHKYELEIAQLPERVHVI